MTAAAFGLGVVVVVLTIAGVIDTLILPRPPAGIGRVALLVVRSVNFSIGAVARLARRYEAQDAILSFIAPLALIVQLLSWAVALVLGFALMLMTSTHSFALALSQSASSLFTVGSIHPGGTPNVAIDIIAGATWVVVVALQIAYLPSLYSKFAHREGLVTLLETRAGQPSWGPEMLVRHHFAGVDHLLADAYAEWERWAAEVSESHTTYPVLMYFRSPDPWLSWVIGLLSVLDAAALHMAIAPQSAPSEARLLLHTGFNVFNRLARSMGWEVVENPGPDTPVAITYEEFAWAVSILEHFGVTTERSAADAWPAFRGWRVNYEHSAYLLADYLTAPPTPWSGTRHGVRTSDVAVRNPPHQLLDRISGGLTPGEHRAR